MSNDPNDSKASDADLEAISGGSLDEAALEGIAGGALNDDALDGIAGGGMAYTEEQDSSGV